MATTTEPYGDVAVPNSKPRSCASPGRMVRPAKSTTLRGGATGALLSQEQQSELVKMFA